MPHSTSASIPYRRLNYSRPAHPRSYRAHPLAVLLGGHGWMGDMRLTAPPARAPAPGRVLGSLAFPHPCPGRFKTGPRIRASRLRAFFSPSAAPLPARCSCVPFQRGREARFAATCWPGYVRLKPEACDGPGIPRVYAICQHSPPAMEDSPVKGSSQGRLPWPWDPAGSSA